MKFRKIDIAIIFSFFLCFVLSLISFEGTCDEIRGDVLRLHVIADSDSPKAQQVKLKVRDAILEKRRYIFESAETLEKAQERVRESLGEIEKLAEDILKKEGMSSKARVSLQKVYFPTRVYSDSVVLPAGYYNALRVVIGAGEGRNWWCVMFPPMCLSAASKQEAVLSEVLSEEEMKIVTANPKYEVRFWLVEKYWELRDKYANKKEATKK